jgi:hypothetical protein
MRWAIACLFLSALDRIIRGECYLHLNYGVSVTEGGVDVLIGGLTLLVALVLAAAYSDRSDMEKT